MRLCCKTAIILPLWNTNIKMINFFFLLLILKYLKILFYYFIQGYSLAANKATTYAQPSSYQEKYLKKIQSDSPANKSNQSSKLDFQAGTLRFHGCCCYDFFLLLLSKYIISY